MSDRERPASVSSGNSLLIDGEVLNLERSKTAGGVEIAADELKRILSLEIARRAIVQGVVTNYKKLQELKERDPDLTISPPALFVVRLAPNSKLGSVITKEALGGYPTTGTKSIYHDPEELKPAYQPYWEAVAGNDYIPHVLTNYGDRHAGGIYLKLHVPHQEIEEEIGYEFPEELQ